MDQGFLIHGTDAVSDQSSEKMFEKIDELERSLCRLRSETLDLRRIKSKCEIHLQMFKRDYDNLKSMYKVMKDRLTQVSDDLPQRSAPEKPPKPRDTFEKPSYVAEAPAAPPSTVSASASSTSNALAHVDLQWEIYAKDPFYSKSNVTLCYALNTCSVLCSVRFDSTGLRFAFADGRTIFLIHTADGSLLASFDIPHPLTSNEIHTRALCFSPDDHLIVITAPNNSVQVFSIASRSVVATLEGHTALVSALLFLPEQNILLSGGFDGAICVWEVGTWRLIKQIPHGVSEGPSAKDDMVIALAESYDRSFVAVGFMNGSVGIYEPSFTQPMNKFNAHSEFLLNVSTAKKSPMIATSSHDKTIKLWSLRGVASCKQTLASHEDCVLTACFSESDQIVFSGSKDETIKAWDQKKGDLLFTITAHKNTLFKIDHHPSEDCFVSCSGDGIVCLWKYAVKQ